MDNHSAWPWNHTRYPGQPDVVSTLSGAVFRYAGGAPLYVFGLGQHRRPTTNYPDPAGRPESAHVFPWDHNKLFPGTGTFPWRHAPGGAVYRVVKGFARRVPSWAPYGGPPAGVEVDRNAIGNAGATWPWNHLKSQTPSVSVKKPAAPSTSKARYSFSFDRPTQSSRLVGLDIDTAPGKVGHRLGTWVSPKSWQGVWRAS